MKLEAFRIKNYRSIIDTGWTRLAPDNITTLIGQNESGKTSILEGLDSFYHGKITDDILRSDLTFPEISCTFLLTGEDLKKINDEIALHPKIASRVNELKRVTLNRKWLNKNESSLFYGDDELLTEHRKMEQEAKKIEIELLSKVDLIINDTSSLVEQVGKEEEERNKLEQELGEMKVKAGKFEKIIQKSGNSRKVELAKEELYELVKKEGMLKVRFDKIDASYRKKSDRLNQLIRVSEYAERLEQAKRIYEETGVEIAELTGKINDIREMMLYTGEEKNIQHLNGNLTDLEKKLTEKQDDHQEYYHSFQYARECFGLALENNNGNDIESVALDNLENKENGRLLEEAGDLLFNYIPDFKLFEDFSSLLPNRIDLEDILNMDSNVEGYNAARNFLIVSGLDANFFRATNDRILKQKIENLNGEITLHFQGYWRQNLGRNNKIRLNFELEHYDFNHPVKKGKPYLEFWIKDEHERLYPKQRSRGVRWFLSFFLELKATALVNNPRGKLLLIDEPGLSLHARAQEDVLKVFEDLKENIQIVYSTHSPHLVNTDKIYRLLAVQRDDEYDDRSETKIYDAQSLSDVTGDTLSPIYTLLGSQISKSNFVRERNNVIVEDTSTFYYLKVLLDIFEPGRNIYLLPANGTASVNTLVNLLTGWKLDFGVLLTDNPESHQLSKELAEKIFLGGKDEAAGKIRITDGFSGLEDIFSTIDFKKFILGERIGITESNLEFIRNQKLRRVNLATAFALRNQNNLMAPSDFDEESQENIRMLLHKVIELV